MTAVTQYGLLFVMAVLNTAIQGLLRYSFRTLGAVDGTAPAVCDILRLASVPTAWLAVFLQVIAFLVWLLLVSRLELTYVLPLSGAIFTVLLFLQGYFLLHEHITWPRIAGAAVILVGMLIMEDPFKLFRT